MSAESGRYRDWCWTFNNVNDKDGMMKWLEYLKNNSRYTVFQPEEASTGNVHLQGYSEFKTAIRFNALKDVYDKIHLEKRQGTRDQARDYCMKEDSAIGDFVEFGEWKEHGVSDVWAAMFKDIDNGDSLRDIASKHGKTFARYHKGVARAIELRTKCDKNEFIQGMIDEEKVPEFIHEKDFVLCYWNGGRLYGFLEGSDKILLEHEGIPAFMLKKMLGGYPISVPVPGGERQWSPTTVLLVQSGVGNTKTTPDPEPVKKEKERIVRKIPLWD